MSQKLLNVLKLWFTLFFVYIMTKAVWQVLGWKVFPLAYLFFVGEIVWSHWTADFAMYHNFFSTIAQYFITPFKVLALSVLAIALNIPIMAGRNGNLRPESTAANQE